MMSKLAAVVMLAVFIFLACTQVASADERSVTNALIEKLVDKGVLNERDYRELMHPASPGDEQALNRRLIRKLYEKGVLDEASFIELSGMAGMDLSGVTADTGQDSRRIHAVPESSPAKQAEPTAREAVKPLDQGLTVVEQGVARAGGDNVSLKINFFFQGGFVNDTAGYSVGCPPTGDMNANAGNQFFVRRARLYLSGNVIEKIGYKVSFETASSTILRDAFAYLDYIPYARFTVGQFKVPFGMEGPEALARHPLANRGLATNFIHASTLRDKGITLSGGYDTELSGMPLGAQYWVGVYNGVGMNKADDNDYKDVGGRVRMKPLLPGLTVGGSWYNGKPNTQFTQTIPGDPPTTIKKNFNKKWDRWAAELDYRPTFAKGLLLQGEYLWQRRYSQKYAASASTTVPDLGRHAHSYGWYALLAYRLNGFGEGWGFMNGFEPVVRYDMLDEDMAISDNERTRTTMGLNYYLAKDTRLMLNYELIHADGRLRLNSLQTIDNVSHKLLTTLLQVKF